MTYWETQRSTQFRAPVLSLAHLQCPRRFVERYPTPTSAYFEIEARRAGIIPAIHMRIVSDHTPAG